MNAIVVDPHVTRLCSYVVASADMFYSEVDQRQIYIRDDPGKGFQVWNGFPGERPNATFDLCQMLLEYAMTCMSSGDMSQAYCDMEDFAKYLGNAMARCVMTRNPHLSVANLAATAMQCVFRAMNTDITVEHSGDGLRYVLENFPLRASAARTGLSYVDQAHFGIKVLCQSLVSAIDPYLIIRGSTERFSPHVISLTKLFPA